MAFATRSSVFAFIKEDTEGVLKDPTAASFTAVREGAALIGAVETTTSDEVRNSIGASKSFVTKEAPTGSIPKYLKTSGVEGQAPDYAILIESCIGSLTVNATEYLTTAGSTAGDSTTRAQLALTDTEGANFSVGQAVLVKDGVNGYAVRNIVSKDETGDPDLLDMSFNFNTAPGSGIGLGKAVFFEPADSAQPTFSSHQYQASTTDSAVHIAEAGCRTTSMTLEYPANDLASAAFEIGGISFYQNPISIGPTNKNIEFSDSLGDVVATLEEKVYQTPIDLADEISAKMTAASALSAGDVITCTFGSSDGKFTISTDGTILSLLWFTGGIGNQVGDTIGFLTGADDTGALTYTSDSAQTYEPPVTPVYDDSEPQIVRDNMLQIGSFSDYECFGGQSLTITVSTPKTDVPNWCATSGVDESLILSREVTVSGTLKFKKHDVERVYKLLRNQTVQLAFVTGQKVAGNWVPGTITSVFLPEVSVTTENVADNDGYMVEQFEGTATVGSTLNDIYINML